MYRLFSAFDTVSPMLEEPGVSGRILLLRRSISHPHSGERGDKFHWSSVSKPLLPTFITSLFPPRQLSILPGVSEWRGGVK